MIINAEKEYQTPEMIVIMQQPEDVICVSKYTETDPEENVIP